MSLNAVAGLALLLGPFSFVLVVVGAVGKMI
jgi:hypothetical protein